jgi:hypothetical protein
VSRGKPCTICTHGERPVIDAAIESGMKHAEIARQFPGISVSMISRHGRKCLGISAIGTPAGELSLEQQVGKWTERANALYLASAASLDLRSQSNAIAAAFRAMELSFRQREKTETKEQERLQRADSPEAPLTITRLDELVRRAEAQARANPVQHLIRKVEGELTLLAESQRSAAREGLREYLNGGVKAA